jgi:hypothetical protein
MFNVKMFTRGGGASNIRSSASAWLTVIPTNYLFTVLVRCFRNSNSTEFRMFLFKFRIFRLEYGIALNSPELRIIPYYGISRIRRNFADSGTTDVTKFPII